MNISVSQLSKYRTCPLQYLWDNKGSPIPVDKSRRKKHQFVGHVIQKLVELFYVEEWWKTGLHRERFINGIGEWADYYTKKEAIVWLPGEYEEKIAIFRETCAKVFRVIKQEKLLVPKQFLRTEFDLTIPLDKHTIFGRGDFLFHKIKDGELIVLDGKAGSQYGKFADKNQLLVYGLGVENSDLKRLPTKYGFWWYRHTKIQWRKFSPDTIQKFKDQSLEAISRLESLNYEPTPGRHCHYCDFRPQCQPGIAFVNAHATEVTDLDIPDNVALVSL